MRSRRPRRAFLALLGAALLGAAPGRDLVQAPGLAWPTDAGRCITSTFCEFRAGHFHSGIDISTNGRTGYECRASDDGDVVRVRVGCKGYGKAVYLAMRDGRTAVYAHLSRFAGAIEDTARAIGRSTGSAYFDRTFPPGTFAVRRGQVVAYTGETGVGVPHLHVEVRDARERPLDPLREGLAVPDSRPPTLRRIALTPLSPGSAVSGETDTHVTEVTAGSAAPVPVVPVEGEIGLSVDVVDATDDCRFDLAPSALELREGARTLAAVHYDSFSFDETDRLDFQIDPRFSYASTTCYQNLFRHPGYDLPFAQGDGSGVLAGGAATEERRRLAILARDAAGNEARTEIELSFAAAPSILSLVEESPEDAASRGPRLAVSGLARAARGLARVEIDVTTDGGRTWADLPPATPAPGGGFRVEVALSGSGVIRASAVDSLGVSGLPRSLGLGEPPPARESVTGEVVTRGSFWEARVGGDVPFAEIVPSAEAGGASSDLGPSPDSSPSHRGAVRAFGKGARIELPARARPAPAPSGGAAVATLVDPWGRVVPVDVVAPRIAQPGDTSWIPTPSPSAEIAFLPTTVREPTAVVVHQAPPPRYASGRLIPLGPLFTVDTGSVPLAGDYEVLLRPGAPAVARSGHAGVFVQNGHQFQYIGGARDVARDGWTVRSRTPLTFGLLEDATPPVIVMPRLESSAGRALLLFRVDDDGSGFDCDGIEVLLNGAPVPCELDTERGEVRAYPDLPPQRGASGKFDIRATDRCGNTSRRTETLRLS
ncbi:MAG: hypothetical protein U0167_05385 [bacterium]